MKEHKTVCCGDPCTCEQVAVRTVPNAHDTTHVVRVYCDICDQMEYQKVRLGVPIEHNCYGISTGVSVTICAWEYEDAETGYTAQGISTEAGIQHDGDFPDHCPLYCTKHNHEEMGG